MTVLVALLLVMGLPWVETDVPVSGRQFALQCHVCEEYNSLQCTHPTTCPLVARYCVTVIVRIFVRFFYVSRQCTTYCSIIESTETAVKSFVLLKPTPFLYAMCCSRQLCNTHAPYINETEGSYRDGGRAGRTRGSSAGLVLLLTLTSASPALTPR